MISLVDVFQPENSNLTRNSSGLNGTLMIRGTKDDYNHWAALGNPGWGWDDVLPLFKKVRSPQGLPRSRATRSQRPTDANLNLTKTVREVRAYGRLQG